MHRLPPPASEASKGALIQVLPAAIAGNPFGLVSLLKLSEKVNEPGGDRPRKVVLCTKDIVR